MASSQKGSAGFTVFVLILFIGIGVALYFGFFTKKSKIKRMAQSLVDGESVSWTSTKTGRTFDLETGDKGLKAYIGTEIKGQIWMIGGKPHWVTSKGRAKRAMDNEKDAQFFTDLFSEIDKLGGVGMANESSYIYTYDLASMAMPWEDQNMKIYTQEKAHHII